MRLRWVPPAAPKAISTQASDYGLGHRQLGWSTDAGEGGTAVGYDSTASGANSTALGYQATTVHEGSTAIGANATTTAANQLMLGASGTSVVIADLDASTAAQSGPVDVVTVDANGTLGRQDVASAAWVEAIHTSMESIAAVTDAQFDALNGEVAQLAGRVSLLGGRVDALEFGLDELATQTSGGIAASMAFGGTMVVPDSTFSMSLNAATYNGQQGFSGSLTARLSEKVYVSGGIAGSTARNTTGGRVGVAFGF